MADSDSDTSSELSFLSRSPSPPSRSPTPPSRSWLDTIMNPATGFPSPPSSQAFSSRQTPCPDDTSSSSPSSIEDGDERPAKRRRVSPAMPRDTRWLDLSDLRDLGDEVELSKLVKAIKTKRKIVVVAGAGISVSAGIPDFRSSAGLFNSLKAQHNLKGSGKQLFDAAVYRDSDSTSSFHQMVRQLSTETKVARPTPFHHLLASLSQQGRLLRLYTQNVDGIDTALPPLATQVPVPSKAPWPKTIQLHGGLSKMVCTKCGGINDFDAELFDGPIPPECQACMELDDLREVEGKRSRGVGKLRPRMVLYNEGNPDDEAIGSCVKADLRRRPDCIIVVGTTLKVPGIKRIVREMTAVVKDHRDGVSVWINNDPEPAGKEFENSWDIVVKGTSDQVAEHAGLRQWDDEEVIDVKEVSEEEVRQVKNRNGFQLIVESPKKIAKLKETPTEIEFPLKKSKPRESRTKTESPTKFTTMQHSLPSPLDSPKPVLVLPSKSDVKVKKLILTNKASKGKPLTTILGPVLSKAPSKVPVRRTMAPAGRTMASKAKSSAVGKSRTNSAKSTAAKQNQTKKRSTKSIPISNSRLAFAPTKGNPSISPLEPMKKMENVPLKKPEPLATSPTRENMPHTPRLWDVKSGETAAEL